MHADSQSCSRPARSVSSHFQIRRRFEIVIVDRDHVERRALDHLRSFRYSSTNQLFPLVHLFLSCIFKLLIMSLWFLQKGESFDGVYELIVLEVLRFGEEST